MWNKEELFNSCFKPNTQLKNYPYHEYVDEFNEEMQCIVTLMSQFLGMDTDKYVTDPMMSLLFTLITFPFESKDPSR